MTAITSAQAPPTPIIRQKKSRKLRVIGSPLREIRRVLFEIPSERENACDANNETAQKLNHPFIPR
jgi:hypothetical protein